MHRRRPDADRRRPGWRYYLIRIAKHLHDLNQKVDDLMATQEDLNNLVSRIDTAVAGLRSDIEDLKNQHPELDLSGLEERVASLEGLDAENPEATPEPAPEPEPGNQP